MNIRIELFVEWRDMWVGVFIDTKKRRVYILPIPCVGVIVRW